MLSLKTSFKKRLFSSGGWAFFTMLAWEGIECLLEYAIAYIISSAITLLVIKLVTTFIVVTATQTMIKPTQRFFQTFFRKIIYVKGDDKVKTLKSIWKVFKSNKCSIAVIVCSVLLAASGSSLIPVDKLPAIPIGSEKVVEAVIQEEDVIATEIVYSKEAVLATETIYGEPIYATEVVWEKEPIYATEVVWEKEPIYATEVVYSKEPLFADKTLFVANATIYEEDGNTVKYAIGDYVPNSEASKHLDKVNVFNKGDIIKEGEILYSIGDVIKEGVIKYNVGDIIEEGVVKYNVGDYIENEILYNAGDVMIPAEILYNVGDVIVAKGTILEEQKILPPTNLTPYLYYVLLAGLTALSGIFFEKPKDYESRKEETNLKKQAEKEIAAEQKEATLEAEQRAAEEHQKQIDAENNKLEIQKRVKLEKIKAEIRAGNI